MRLVAASLPAALAAIAVCGCGIDLGPDPHADHYSTIVNDEPYSVDIMLCAEDDCGKPGLPFFFQDRYNRRETLEAGSDHPYIPVLEDGVVQVYRVVRTSDDRELGCLPLVRPAGPPLLARVSQRVPCTGAWDQDVRWPA